jgi:uncharacterized protein YdbL (DUF1318 family)
MRRAIAILLVVATAFLPAARSASNRDSAEHASTVVFTDDALFAFFDDLDRKATTLQVRDNETPDEVPAFPRRDKLHAQLAERLAEIDRLRSRTLAGETARGFLEPRGPLSNSDEAIVAEENADRLSIYEAIAAQAKVKIDVVGRTRAQHIALRCKRGVWVQGPRGDWGQKT